MTGQALATMSKHHSAYRCFMTPLKSRERANVAPHIIVGGLFDRRVIGGGLLSRRVTDWRANVGKSAAEADAPVPAATPCTPTPTTSSTPAIRGAGDLRQLETIRQLKSDSIRWSWLQLIISVLHRRRFSRFKTIQQLV